MSLLPPAKKPKLNENFETTTSDNNMEKIVPRCKHFVKRKKRFCKMTVMKGKEFCGEHLSEAPNTSDDITGDRIPCPLDPKHTVYAKNLNKHLKICNSKPLAPENVPDYIVAGLNAGSDDDEDDASSFEIKLSTVEEQYLNSVIVSVENLYEQSAIATLIEEYYASHETLESELKNPINGQMALKHLTQVSALLGIMLHYNFLQHDTCYIEFGAGKGQMSYWMVTSAKQYKYSRNFLLLIIDRASLRHKQDNKILDKDMVMRVRTDISDLDISKLKFSKMENCSRIIGFGKHLCGGATDMTIRGIVRSNKVERAKIKSEGVVIALCCHHKCDWKTFVGKKFFAANGIDRKAFNLMIRMVGWAHCGTGLSRERRKEISERENGTATPQKLEKARTQNSAAMNITREQKEIIGNKCKRVIDLARIKYLEENGFECFLKYYVHTDITPENICLIARLKRQTTSTAAP